MNTQENNKLIAEFMGAVGSPMYNPIEWDIYITGFLDVDANHENAQHFYKPNEMKYHSSWDWLMPVVERCYQCDFEEGGDLHMMLNDAIMTINIKEVYKVVVEFINWYNENK